MGMTKALQERIYAQANLGNTQTSFVCVRYGNVVASRGSVIPLFLEQIRAGGPVTLTLESMTRFLLTLDRAVDTIFEAVRSALPGETYVPKVPAARVIDIARCLINGANVPIVFTGIRPGEKIHESLVSEEECFRTIERNGYYVILPILPELRNGSIEQPTLQNEYSSSHALIGLDELDRLLAAYRDGMQEKWQESETTEVVRPPLPIPSISVTTGLTPASTENVWVKDNPLVSVIIPCYNRETFIADAIDSALAQTYQNLEIIVVNDGSTDGTENVINGYLANPRVRYIKHEKNRGIPAARNTAIRQARGDYVAFLDSDDMWLPKKIESQLEVFSRDVAGDVGLVWSNAFFRDNQGNTETVGASVPPDIGSLPRDTLLRRLFLHNFITAQTVMVRRTCFDKVGLLDEHLKGGADDFDFWLRLAPYFRFEYVSIPLVVARLHDGNYSEMGRLFQDNLMIIAKAVSQNPELAALKPARLRELYHDLGMYYLEKRNWQEARSNLSKAIGFRPFKLKDFLAWGLAFCGPFGRLGLRTYRQINGLESRV
jgi:glycosyltransferase involved in cell wall biosynthesis